MTAKPNGLDNLIKPEIRQKSQAFPENSGLPLPHEWQLTPARKTGSSAHLEQAICWLLWPQFEELPIGMIAMTTFLTVFAEKDVQNLIWKALEGDHVLIVAFVLFVLLSGGITAFYHLFSDAEKNSQDKKQMLAIASVSCIFSGVVGGYYLYAAGGDGSFIRLIGAWNGIQGLLLAILLYLKEIDETAVADTNALFSEAVAGLLTILAVFTLLKYWFVMHWIDTFSICIAVSMNFSLFPRFIFSIAGISRRLKKLARPNQSHK